MDISSILQNINWVAVFVASLSSFLLGGLWYSPILFGKRWMKENNINPNTMEKPNMALIFGTTFLLQVIAAVFLALFTRNIDATAGALKGFIIGTAWVATSIGTHYLFERKSLALFFINAGYSIVLLTIMGAILGAWH